MWCNAKRQQKNIYLSYQQQYYNSTTIGFFFFLFFTILPSTIEQKTYHNVLARATHIYLGIRVYR